MEGFYMGSHGKLGNFICSGEIGVDGAGLKVEIQPGGGSGSLSRDWWWLNADQWGWGMIWEL